MRMLATDGLGLVEVIDVIDALHREGHLAPAFRDGEHTVGAVLQVIQLDVSTVIYS